MPDEEQDDLASQSQPANAKSSIPQPLIDELGVEDIEMPVAATRGRIFSAAGRESPLAEFTDEHLVMRPPQMPYHDEGPSEDIHIRVDMHGILLDELGNPKHIAGAKFRGATLWWLGEQRPGTTKHFVAWFDHDKKPRKLYVNGEALTADIVFRLRNKTHDGELSFFGDITTEE